MGRRAATSRRGGHSTAQRSARSAAQPLPSPLVAPRVARRKHRRPRVEGPAPPRVGRRPAAACEGCEAGPWRMHASSWLPAGGVTPTPPPTHTIMPALATDVVCCSMASWMLALHGTRQVAPAGGQLGGRTGHGGRGGQHTGVPPARHAHARRTAGAPACQQATQGHPPQGRRPPVPLRDAVKLVDEAHPSISQHQRTRLQRPAAAVVHRRCREARRRGAAPAGQHGARRQLGHVALELALACAARVAGEGRGRGGGGAGATPAACEAAGQWRPMRCSDRARTPHTHTHAQLPPAPCPLPPTLPPTCARVPHQQHVRLAAYAGAAGVAPRHPAHQHQQRGQLDVEQAVQLGAHAGHNLAGVGGCGCGRGPHAKSVGGLWRGGQARRLIPSAPEHPQWPPAGTARAARHLTPTPNPNPARALLRPISGQPACACQKRAKAWAASGVTSTSALRSPATVRLVACSASPTCRRGAGQGRQGAGRWGRRAARSPAPREPWRRPTCTHLALPHRRSGRGGGAHPPRRAPGSACRGPWAQTGGSPPRSPPPHLQARGWGLT